jgi:formate dehydrogenase assembly factor FdhD
MTPNPHLKPDFKQQESSSIWTVQPIRPRKKEVLEDHLLLEEPLEIVVNGHRLAVLMRMPGEEKELTAGFCLSEG